MHLGIDGHCATNVYTLVYLNVTIICEYNILRFWDSDDFAGIIFCDHEVELNFAISHKQR